MMQEMRKGLQSGDWWKKPLPERLTLQETHMAARLEQVKSTHAAFDKLYALLTPDQKSSADDILLPLIGMGPGRGMGPWIMFN